MNMVLAISLFLILCKGYYLINWLNKSLYRQCFMEAFIDLRPKYFGKKPEEPHADTGEQFWLSVRHFTLAGSLSVICQCFQEHSICRALTMQRRWRLTNGTHNGFSNKRFISVRDKQIIKSHDRCHYRSLGQACTSGIILLNIYHSTAIKENPTPT